MGGLTFSMRSVSIHERKNSPAALLSVERILIISSLIRQQGEAGTGLQRKIVWEKAAQTADLDGKLWRVP
jgi:hypothetical protein